MKQLISILILLSLYSCNSSNHTNDKAEGIGQAATFTQNQKGEKEEDCDTKTKEDVKKELEELEQKQKKGLGLNPQGGCTLDELK